MDTPELATKQWRTLALRLVWAVALGLCACGRQKDGSWLGSGTLEARQVTVSAKLAGELVALRVHEGDTVALGQPLAAIDSTKLVLQRAQLLAAQKELHHTRANALRAIELASAQLDNAAKQYDRFRSLAERGSATAQQLEGAQLGYQAALTQLESARNTLAGLDERARQLRAQRDLLESQIRDALVVAPLAGVVVGKYVEQGEVVAPGSPIVTIADLSEMWLKVYLPEPEMGKVSLGTKVTVRPDAFPREGFAGTVTWISPKAEFTPKNVQTRAARAELVFAVRVTVPNPQGKLLVGMPAEVFVAQ